MPQVTKNRECKLLPSYQALCLHCNRANYVFKLILSTPWPHFSISFLTSSLDGMKTKAISGSLGMEITRIQTKTRLYHTKTALHQKSFNEFLIPFTFAFDNYISCQKKKMLQSGITVAYWL